MSGSSYGHGKSSYDKFYSKDDELKVKEWKQIGYPIFGLINRAKSYNCFLNSVIQSFWNIGKMRTFFLYFCQDQTPQDDEPK